MAELFASVVVRILSAEILQFVPASCIVKVVLAESPEHRNATRILRILFAELLYLVAARLVCSMLAEPVADSSCDVVACLRILPTLFFCFFPKLCRTYLPLAFKQVDVPASVVDRERSEPQQVLTVSLECGVNHPYFRVVRIDVSAESSVPDHNVLQNIFRFFEEKHSQRGFRCLSAYIHFESRNSNFDKLEISWISRGYGDAFSESADCLEVHVCY